EVADRAMALLRARGIQARANLQRGLDHGAFVPLALMGGFGNLPVVQLSLPAPSRAGPNARLCLEMGRALAPLRHEAGLSGGARSTGTEGLVAPRRRRKRSRMLCGARARRRTRASASAVWSAGRGP
ncbi:unnamed protein product, partial [Prorocentrum cordatum]